MSGRHRPAKGENQKQQKVQKELRRLERKTGRPLTPQESQDAAAKIWRTLR
jgi:hypothetical protein